MTCTARKFEERLIVLYEILFGFTVRQIREDECVLKRDQRFFLRARFESERSPIISRKRASITNDNQIGCSSWRRLAQLECLRGPFENSQ